MVTPVTSVCPFVRFPFQLIALLPITWLLTQPVRADIFQVTFTGSVFFTYDSEFGGPSFYGIEPGDAFSAVLTYDPSQPNLGTVEGQGQYGVYDYTVTVQTAGGPVTLGGPISWPCTNCADNPINVDSPSTVNNGGSFVAFTFQGNNVISDDSLADVNWQNVLTESTESQGTFISPIGSPVREGFADMFLRAPNAAVVVEGSISQVSVEDIPTPVPEPSGIALLATVIAVLGFTRCTRRTPPGERATHIIQLTN